MNSTDNIIDLALHRNRRQAQHLGRLLWALYAQQAGLAARQWSAASATPKAPRQA